MDRILISACLLGRPVRYDGRGRKLHDALLELWQSEGRLVPICPEIAAGFPTPRPPAEIRGADDGEAVLDGCGGIFEPDGHDVTAGFLAGAQAAVSKARDSKCRFALLTDGSPSCGSVFIYDGRFDGTKRRGFGVVTAALRREGVKVYAETEIAALADRLDRDNPVS
ncbi:MAG: DUF523 domain-containing protein [Pseudomonadota bacterium]